MKLSLVVSILLLWTQVNVNRDAQAKKGAIEGVAVRLGSGGSVSGARVTLTKVGGAAAAPTVTATLPGAASVAPATTPPPQGARGAAPPPVQIPPVFTNNEGKFAFPDLDDGSYTVQIQANGYVPFSYGQKFTNGPGAPVKVKSGEPVNNLSVTLKPAGNISGQIMDNANQPLANVSIRLLRSAYDSFGQRSLQTVAATQTNDRGEYRFYWVTPGRYSIMAGNPSTSADPLIEMMSSSLGGVTNFNLITVPLGFAFYPGVKDPAGATIIDLRAGADLTNLNMTMIPLPATFHIRGRMIDSRTGQPPKSANVSANPQIPGMVSDNFLDNLVIDGGPIGYNPANGTFDIRNLLPGTYEVSASAQDPTSGNRGSPPNPGPPTRTTGTTQATISDSDVDNLVIITVPAVTVSGRVRMDPAASQGTVRIQLTEAGRTVNSSLMATATSKPDGSFQLQNIVQGDYRISVNGMGTRGSIFIKEARYEGADVLSSALHVSGVSNSPLDILIAAGGGRIRGSVSDSRSQPVSFTRVVLVPDRLRDHNDLYKTTATGENGQFDFTNISPGDYRVFAWEDIEEFEWFDPQLIAQSDASSRVFHITESSAEMADVRLLPVERGTR